VTSPHPPSLHRLINSEGDGLSGLVVDVLGGCAVVQSCAAWVERYKEQVTAAVAEAAGVSTDSIIWRPASEILKEEGITPPEGSSTPGSSMASEDAGAENSVVILELGVQYRASPLGQKTGFYADQRENKAFVAGTAKGRRMLDLCCYTGGFALAAAKAGAAQALGVDSSAKAIALARANAAMNGLEGTCSFVEDDVEDFLRDAVGDGQQWDLVSVCGGACGGVCVYW
jgi:23S rRNA G2069 N7-methylase RlmK/C1962 C5-methylase RlmI